MTDNCLDFDPDEVEALPVVEGPRGLKGDKGNKGDKGEQGDTGEGASDPGDLTLIFNNRLI
jgi:hypothetical protein